MEGEYWEPDCAWASWDSLDAEEVEVDPDIDSIASVGEVPGGEAS